MLDNLYTFADKHFFSRPSELSADKEYSEVITSLLSKDWTVKRHNIWLTATPKNIDMPLQGFKIHVSAIEDEAIEVIHKAVQVCLDHKAAFKVICRKDIANQLASKSTGRSGSGKLVTIYPVNIEAFKVIIHALYMATKDNSGPYILSDKRYKDSKVVHYRYGGYKLIPKQKPDGTTDTCLIQPDGTLVKDERAAFYSLPSWVDEPFKEEESTDSASEITPLAGRYQVLEALSFSNSGGVYKALDLHTEKMVVVKEARPYVQFSSLNTKSIYADTVLKNEHKILEALQGSEYFPKPVDCFSEWEHSFLVAEFVQGEAIRSLSAKEAVTLMPFTGNLATAEKFKQQFTWISQSCIEAITYAHSQEIVLADISPNNIMVDITNKRIKFIDLEGAFRVDIAHEHRDSIPILATPGFTEQATLAKEGATYKGDWYGLSMVLYSMLLPIQQAFDMNAEFKWTLLEKMVKDSGLPAQVTDVIDSLSKGLVADAKVLLNELDNISLSKEVAGKIERLDAFPAVPSNFYEVEHTLQRSLSNITQLLRTGIERQGHDFYLPVDFQAFDTHMGSLAFGYSGPALLLARACKDIPQGLASELDKSFAEKEASPGILVGYAGMALSQIELGNYDVARELLMKSMLVPYEQQASNFAYGLAGIGHGFVKLYQHTQRSSDLQQAIEAAWLLRNRRTFEHGGYKYGSSVEGNEGVGFMYGSAGIALFLTQLFTVTNKENYLEEARLALQFDLHAGLNSDGHYQWGDSQNSALVLPYIENGSAGIGSVVLRLYQATKDEYYLDIARKLALSSYSLYTAQQGLFSGSVGIADFLFDMYQVTQEQQYKESALSILERSVLFSVSRDEGELFPGRTLIRLSTDLAMGSSGIGIVFDRVLNNKSRPFFDI
ncbi:class III lanthionine synthetase LanKC [Pseudoalteromonas sp. SMS1]|uniref:class III lanthionine synthetase LanKC n=1 Tax=Pseudoalteromonas sp. SMS1 TaxID=2908894 RepID=UPI001F31D147|nr:class III lanthionine synthetase LanKC [Pseudoalteromonas sp. SMS1]MCF2858451.1 class III lanthionine synthetase LanKC [Pseudoalteromonas sp. SMS1]